MTAIVALLFIAVALCGVLGTLLALSLSELAYLRKQLPAPRKLTQPIPLRRPYVRKWTRMFSGEDEIPRFALPRDIKGVE